jgi:hypothetical protein
MYEEHGTPEKLGAVFSGVLLTGVLGAIDGLLWAWAIDMWILGGALIGFIIGGVVGAFMGFLVGGQTDRTVRKSHAAASGAMLGPPVMLIGLLAVIVGVARLII